MSRFWDSDSHHIHNTILVKKTVLEFYISNYSTVCNYSDTQLSYFKYNIGEKTWHILSHIDWILISLKIPP
jgi:hypothetical protein